MSEVYKPSEAAALLNVSPQTIRRWARLFAAALSPGANPSKDDRRNRRYAQEDMALFRMVDKLKHDGKTIAEIAQILPTIPLSELPDLEPETPNLPALPDLLAAWERPLVALAEQNARFERQEAEIAELRRRLDDMESQQRRSLVDRLLRR